LGWRYATFLSHDEMRQLMGETRKHFKLLDGGEYSIEVDPRKVDRETVACWRTRLQPHERRCQDFDERCRSRQPRAERGRDPRGRDAARPRSFKSVSVDLIYGLPHQTVMGFNRTLERVSGDGPGSPVDLQLRAPAQPVQAAAPHQRRDLPSADTKLQIWRWPSKLTDAGYVYIGMDHFAKPDDELAVAQRQGACTATSRAIRPTPIATCCLSAFRRSARSGRPTTRTSRPQTSTTIASMPASCRYSAASS
jgi:oxygen-independent coproporphyrinogen-3 oxidase